jgi:hypothetical protein
MSNVFIVHPELCAEVLRTKHHWAYVFASACRTLSADHCGWVTEHTAEMLRVVYGWSKSKYNRILEDTLEMGWAHVDEGKIYVAGPVRIAESLGLTFVGKHDVLISSDCLKSNNAIKQTLLKAFLHDKRSPLSQKYIRTKTGIPERTQRHYLNRCSDVYRIANYIVTTLRIEDVIGARSTDHPGAFVKDGRVLMQSSNTYVINEGATSPHSVTSTRKCNARLHALGIRGSGKTCEPGLAKLWYNTDAEFFKAQKLMSHGRLLRRPFYYIKKWVKRSSDGLIHIQEYDLYVDPLYSCLAG